MSEERGSIHRRWAVLRLSVVGSLLSSPPERGGLCTALEDLSERTWLHPETQEPMRFTVPTIERWFYAARRAGDNPIEALRKKVRKDAGENRSLTQPLCAELHEQYEAHRTWSYQLHADNLVVLCEEKPDLGPCPSYTTIRRYMKAHGLLKQRRVPNLNRPGAQVARDRLETYEVRSYEATHVHGLWHTDFHFGSRRVVTRFAVWEVPKLLCFLDDYSRAACHAQWYLDEEAESFVHGLSQGLQKRGMPRGLMSDGGAAMKAEETEQGLSDLSILHHRTLPYSPYQNAKQEVFWGQVEGRFLAMLEGVPDLTLTVLNEAMQAWVELEYNRTIHSEIGVSPLSRLLSGPNVGRACPSSDQLRRAFRVAEWRTQRRSDGTVSVGGARFEVPSRLRHVERLRVRYARWDLSTVDVVDETTDAVVATLYPLDKAKNADGHRRLLDPVEVPAMPAVKPTGMAPLLRKLVTDYQKTGLPPAYIPKCDVATTREKES